MQRRNFFQGVLGLAGINATQVIGSEPSKNQCLLTININVGKMATFKAAAFVDRIHEELKQKMPENWKCLVVPVRDQPTSALLQYKSDNDLIDAKEIEIDLYTARKQMFNTQVVVENPKDIIINKKEIEEYVLLMLGSPVMNVELDKQQLELCIRLAEKDVLEAHLKYGIGTTEHDYIALIKEGSLSHAKIVLGQIRCKFTSYPGLNGPCELDGPSLKKEGQQQLENWKLKLQELNNV